MRAPEERAAFISLAMTQRRLSHQLRAQARAYEAQGKAKQAGICTIQANAKIADAVWYFRKAREGDNHNA